MSYDIMREFGVDLRLRDSENMGPTRSEAKMADEIERLRARLAKVERERRQADERGDEAMRRAHDAERDARRYRWLRDSPVESVDETLLDKEPNEWDAAIDAALERTP